jgi:elongation factor Ts
MQIAACPGVEFIKFEDIPEEVKEREKSIEMLKDDLANKPTELKEKIVSGRIQKRLKDLVLLEQPFIRDSSITIEDLVKQSISVLGENIQIRRFQKFLLGEGLEKKQDNFKEEVESMMK